MLTREQLAMLAPILTDAIIHRDGIYHLRLTLDYEVPIVNGAGPLTQFAEGWVPSLVFTLFQPMLLLEFRHASGRAGYWLLDMSGRFIVNAFSTLPPHLLDIVRMRGRPIVHWLQAMSEPGVPCMQPPSVDAALALHLDTLRDLAQTISTLDKLPMPTDQMLERQPDTEPVAARVEPAGDMVIQQLGAPVPLRPGWRVSYVTTLLAPLVILELLHEDGHQGVWYVDRQMNLLANSAIQLTGRHRDHLTSLTAGLFGELRERVIMAPPLPLSPFLQLFLSMARLTRDDLLTFYFTTSGLNERETLTWAADVPPVAPLAYAATVTGGGKVLLDPGHCTAACMHFLRSELFRQVESGVMMWPSPVDGQMFEVVPRTFYIDDLCFAYQMYDARHGLTFYLFAMEGFFRGFSIYIPSVDLVVAMNAQHLSVTKRYTAKAGQLLLRHLALYEETAAAILEPPAEVVHSFRGYHAIHLGHFIWQDLSGISYLVDAFPLEKLPRCYVFDTQHHPEIYGPIDEIFPELAGKVVRLDKTFVSHIPQFYRERISVIKSTGISVPAQVGRRIIAAFRRSERWADPVARAAEAYASGAVVIVGLRIGNRTVDDMGAFTERLVAMLASELGRVTIVIDGHNSVSDEPGGTYASFGDTLSGGSTFMQRELAIAQSLERIYAGSDVTIVNNIDRPVQESVIWCSQANFFVAPWGAALAKYRWVCNTPGLATVGRWNLENRSDLAIYHHPGAMDNPTLMMFNAPEAATDLLKPDDIHIDRSNYYLDEIMVFAQVRDLIERFVPLRLIRSADLSAGGYATKRDNIQAA
ncbi:MAG: hypothetical protein ACRYG8_08310 [Janthinobacterium lividum]